MIFSINTKQDLSLEEIKKSIARARDEAEIKRKNEAEMVEDFYDGYQDAPKYLENYGFKDYEQAIPLQTVNITRKVIDKISLVYKKAPDREFNKSVDAFEKWRNFNKENRYFDVWMKNAERRKNLMGVVLKRPAYVKDVGRRWWIDTTFEPHFTQFDHLNPIAYSIPMGHDVTNSLNIDEDLWLFVSDKFHFMYTKDSEKIIEDPSFPNGEHGLDMLPVVESRADFPVSEYWNMGAYDLVRSNQLININLNNLNYAMHFQAFNYLWADGVAPKEGQELKINTKQVTLLPEGSTLNALDLNPKIVEMIEAIKFEMQAISKNYNVSMDWEMSGDPSSGFALLVKNIDLMEAREDDVELAELEEQQLFDIIRKQQQVYNINEPKLPEGEVNINFQEIDFPINEKEQIEIKQWKIDNNMLTPIDILQTEEGLTEKQATERYNRNKELNASLTPAQEAFRNELNNIGGNNEET